jgi:hypothetical protein
MPALPPADLRQDRALPPDAEQVAGPTAAGPHPAPAPDPARHLPRLLQPCDHTEHCDDRPQRRPTPPGPKPPRAAPHYTPATGASATTASTYPACSPCGTTAACTASASVAATPAPTSSSWSTTSTSGAHPPTANYSANSSSTPAATTNHNPERERCPETPVHGVPRHRIGAPGRIRTCAPASG